MTFNGSIQRNFVSKLVVIVNGYVDNTNHFSSKHGAARYDEA